MATPPASDPKSGTSHSERRRFSRIPFDADTSIQQDTLRWPSQLLDISMKGLLITEPEHCSLDENLPVDVTIALSDDSLIELVARLSWRKEGWMGFIVERIDPVSLSHLRRLIELNLGDSEAADRELHALINPD
ncbi:PilZ domain-containing protein [Pseudomaricurvus sp.]|uniref:PilZ domain-containing protein n=1 Tax=Pseudomaricurvus sp. TaxID=2004510 RepID=UPI003F6B54C4